jgi:hypothetical protein
MQAFKSIVGVIEVVMSIGEIADHITMVAIEDNVHLYLWRDRAT